MHNGSMRSFDAQMRTIHDHLYATANIKLPEDLQAEVAKVIQTLTWRAAVSEGSAPDRVACERALSGDREAITSLANALREDFKAYNNVMQRYPRNNAALKLDNGSLAYITAALNDVDMTDATRDWLGDALEVFRSTAAKRLGGQFFTDQRVTSLAMDLLEFDPATDDLVDICAGTGGFLIAGARRAQLSGISSQPALVGVEIDPSLTHLANSTLQHMTNFPNDVVFNADSFRPPQQWSVSLRKALVAGTHRKLATNPPFGQKITIKDPLTLKRFDLGFTWSRGATKWTKGKKTGPTPPDILFLERNLDLAIPGEGRVAIVLPYQILSGPKLGYVRQWILENARIVAVVDLPDDTFQPWTGTKTSLLVLERRERPVESFLDEEDYEIFMSVASEIGHDRRGNPVIDSSGRIVCDLPEVGKAFNDFRENNETVFKHKGSFVVKSSKIRWETDLRLNAAFYSRSNSQTLDMIQAMSEDDVEVKTVGEVTEAIFFPGRFKRNYVENGVGAVPFLGGTNVTQLIPTNRKYVSAADPRIDELTVESGWILVTRSGSTGIVSSVPEPWDGYAMSEHVIRIVPNEDVLPAGYLEAYLRSEMGQTLLAQGVFGSVIDEITPEHIAAMPIPIPKDVEKLSLIADTQKLANQHRSDSIATFLRANTLFQEVICGDAIAVGEDPNLSLPADNVIDQGEELIEGEVVLERVRPIKH